MLPYDRDALEPGTMLPERDEPFLRALLSGRPIHVDGRETAFGDALLALAHVEALRDAAALLGLPLTLTASPLIARMLEVPALELPRRGAIRVGLALECEGVLVPRPDVPVLCTASRVYAHQPARRYLDAERRLGIRLPRDDRFLPALQAAPAAARGRPLICYIAASSWPARKDYGTHLFAEVARQLGDDFDHVLVPGLEDDDEPPSPLQPVPCKVYDIPALLALFTQSTLVLGNDTGLLHAAAMTQSAIRRGVIGIYSRHSYLRFTTGDARQYAIATPFAQAMALGNRNPGPLGVDDSRYPRAGATRRVPPQFIADCARRVLED
jgi:Glycosyltransferase family 9 (heptosyltransferase)